MLNITDSRNYLQHIGGFTDEGMKIEWAIFVETMGKRKEYSRKEISKYAGY